ncbi:MAG TPA: chemotaxis protein [Rhodocyclaceae bacterium]|nr:chemotaxis protein [Rhodocyclaceae bacterium]
MSQAWDTGGELRRIVRINEEIKSVVATAFKINLMAMNAIFLAKRAGQAALGFSVLSNELRRFATDLQQQMEVLRQMTHGSVASVTALVKSERLNRVVDRLRAEVSGQARAIIERYLRTRQTTAFVLHQEAIATQNRRLGQTIADTAQLVELGSVLARSAKIEAAYGGSFSAALMQVSSDFEHTIAEIHRSLELLSRHRD